MNGHQHPVFITVSDANGNDYAAELSAASKLGDDTVAAWVRVTSEPNGFGWNKGTIVYTEGLKDIGNGVFGT
jgi:hypothetical protein